MCCAAHNKIASAKAASISVRHLTLTTGDAALGSSHETFLQLSMWLIWHARCCPRSAYLDQQPSHRLRTPLHASALRRLDSLSAIHSSQLSSPLQRLSLLLSTHDLTDVCLSLLVSKSVESHRHAFGLWAGTFLCRAKKKKGIPPAHLLPGGLRPRDSAHLHPLRGSGPITRAIGRPRAIIQASRSQRTSPRCNP